MRGACLLMEMHDRNVIAVVGVKRILIMASWTLKRMIIVSLILPLLTDGNLV